MALGPLLLQPQKLDRLASIDPAQAFADDLVALLHQIALNPDHLEVLRPIFQRAFETMGDRLRERFEPRLPRVLQELESFVSPVLERSRALAQQAGELDSAPEVLDLIGEVLDSAITTLRDLSEPSLRTQLQRFHSIVTDTLGLRQDLIKDELRQVVATVRRELIATAITLAPRPASICFALAALLGRIERELFAQWPTLDIAPDRITQLIMSALREIGFEELRVQLTCLLGKARAALGGVAALADLATPSAFGPHSVGAAQAVNSGDTYCWYASWLYATKRQGGLSFVPGMPADEVWVTADRNQLVLRRAFNEDEVLHEVSTGNLSWDQAPQFTSGSSPECFTFGVFSRGFMEIWTRVMATLVEAAKAIMHTVACATSPKEYAVNIPLILWNLTKTLTMAFGEAPLPGLLGRNAGWGQGGQYLFSVIPWLAVFGGSFEGIHSKANGGNTFLQWLTLIGGDALNAYSFHGIASTVHDAFLSVWTLMNSTGPAAPPEGEGAVDMRPQNRVHGDAVIGLFLTGASWLLTKLIPRQHYAFPFHPENGWFYLWWLLVSPVVGCVGGMLGTFAVWAISRTFDWKQLGEQIGFGALRSFLTFILVQYSFMEGDTDGGKYNPTGTAAFAGYPAGSSSPYKLPYERGVSSYVGQANQGMFSHMRFNRVPQIYGYDFAMDSGDEVLCCRAGTVVDYFDWLPDDTEPSFDQITAAITAATPTLVPGQTGIAEIETTATTTTYLWNWNFIMIRHDASVAEHDKADAGAAVTTFAVYGHGRQGSIRAAFAARGVAANAIIGTAVQQGQVIMGAGDVGTSFHNHLHMHVLGSTATTPAAPPVTASQLTQYTLPFVFTEARPAIGRDGVLRNLTWYRSDNEKVT